MTKKPSKKQGDELTIDCRDLQADRTDPQGSYTGCPVDPYEAPVQDADDL